MLLGGKVSVGVVLFRMARVWCVLGGGPTHHFYRHVVAFTAVTVLAAIGSAANICCCRVHGFNVRGEDSPKHPKWQNAASEDRTHDLRIMRPTHCQLRYHRLNIANGRAMNVY